MSLNFVLSQILIVIAYALFAMSYLAKNHKTVLVFSSCSLAVEGSAYLFLSAWSGIAMVLIAGTRNVLFWAQTRFLEKNPKYKNYNWVALFIVYGLCIAGCFITYQGFFSLFSILACMVFTYSLWQEDRFWYHVWGVVSSVFMVVYNIAIGSTFGAVLEAMVMLWIIFQLATKYSYRGFVFKHRHHRYNHDSEPVHQQKQPVPVLVNNLIDK